jgi:hypothetical protein
LDALRPEVIAIPPRIIPISERIIPVSEQIIPMSERIIPIPEQIIPVSEQIIPMSERIIPMSERIIPMPEAIVPIPQLDRRFWNMSVAPSDRVTLIHHAHRRIRAVAGSRQCADHADHAACCSHRDTAGPSRTSGLIVDLGRDTEAFPRPGAAAPSQAARTAAGARLRPRTYRAGAGAGGAAGSQALRDNERHTQS